MRLAGAASRVTVLARTASRKVVELFALARMRPPSSSRADDSSFAKRAMRKSRSEIAPTSAAARAGSALPAASTACRRDGESGVGKRARSRTAATRAAVVDEASASNEPAWSVSWVQREEAARPRQSPFDRASPSRRLASSSTVPASGFPAARSSATVASSAVSFARPIMPASWARKSVDVALAAFHAAVRSAGVRREFSTVASIQRSPAADSI